MDDQQPYELVRTERGFEVVSAGGYSKVLCQLEGQARLYLSLMKEAYEAGHKEGYREARRVSRLNNK